MKIVGVTACPSGLAHTYMAQENLENELRRRGYEYKIETQGGMGPDNALSLDDVQSADVVILAASIALEGMERFEGKPVLQVPVDRAVRDVQNLVNEAEQLVEGKK